MSGAAEHSPGTGWIDLHCHVIPGVDDGPQTLDDALEMVAMAARAGTVLMVATPHRNGPVASIDDSATIMTRFHALCRAVDGEGIAVRLLPGAEVYCRENLLERLSEDRTNLTLAGSDYFLLEFPPDILIPGTDELIRRVVRQGLIPIIVHPERNEQVQHNPAQLLPYIEAGAMIQLTAGSIEGRLGGSALECAKTLLNRNLVHAVASDCHDCQGRSPRLDGLLVENLLEADRADLLMRRLPLALLDNQAPPDIGPIREAEKAGLSGIIDWILRRMR